jgi:hypothetical protein
VQRLGEQLVAKGLCGKSAVEEALQAQAVFGGRIGTNLLEGGALTEERLALALGDRHHVPALYGNLIPEPEALQLISAADADRWEVVPLRASDRKLALLTGDPGNVAVLDEVAFATGRSVLPFVVPEARLWRLLASAYRVFREERGIEHHRAPAAGSSPGTAGADLIDEAGFDALYGRVGLTESPTPMPFVRPPVLPPAAAPPAVTRPPLVRDEPEPSPLTFQEAVRFLEGVEERGAIARTVLRYARSRFQRAVLLTVRRGVVHLPLAAGGVGATVVATRSHFLGPLPKTESNVRLLKALGGGVPRSAFVVPILALGRVVNVLYADNGRGELVDPTDLGELLILATRIAQGYDALARRAV